jgi:hypothetical protein
MLKPFDKEESILLSGDGFFVFAPIKTKTNYISYKKKNPPHVEMDSLSNNSCIKDYRTSETKTGRQKTIL